jgi:transcriptional antiterminator NusG
MAEEKKHWYALRTISGKEMKVKEMLEAARNNVPLLKECVEQVLVPTEKVYVTRNGKRTVKDHILFSGYVYVKAELQGEVENFLQNTSNVINFLRSREGGKRPEVIPETQILAMMGYAEAQKPGADDAYVFSEGDKVKVNYGPFSGLIGEVREVNQEKRELTVMVKVFGRETPLMLDNSQVERE